MASIELRRPGHKLRLLLLEENGDGEDPTVWEMECDENTFRGDRCSGDLSLGNPRTGPTKLHAWLSAKRICTCESGLRAEQELAKKVEELTRSNRELEQFAYIASHDLREPLRMVATYTQLLAERYRGKLDRSADQYIDYATDGALRMQKLIDGLLELSRVGRQGSARRSVDCNLIMEEVLRDLVIAIAETGAVVHCESLPEIVADRAYVQQIFQNLIGNAIKFRGKQSPVVTVMAQGAGQDWLFTVTDNGIGIAPEEVENIFGAFKRLHSRLEYPGNGVGLAMCKKIVEHYGGRIWVESQPGSGSSFKFTLPARNSAVEAAHA